MHIIDIYDLHLNEDLKGSSLVFKNTQTADPRVHHKEWSPGKKGGDRDFLVTPRFFTGWQSSCARALLPRSVSSRWQLIQTLSLNEHRYEKQLPGGVKVNNLAAIQGDSIVHCGYQGFFYSRWSFLTIRNGIMTILPPTFVSNGEYPRIPLKRVSMVF